MSFRELTMIDVKEVLRRWQAGQSARQMAREGVVSRRTAARYIETGEAVGLATETERTDEVVRESAGRVQARPEPEPSDARQVLEQQRARSSTGSSATSRSCGCRSCSRVRIAAS